MLVFMVGPPGLIITERGSAAQAQPGRDRRRASRGSIRGADAFSLARRGGIRLYSLRRLDPWDLALLLAGPCPSRIEEDLTQTVTSEQTERVVKNEPAPSGLALALGDLLACPDCRAPLSWREAVLEPCPRCGRVFDTAGGIPLLHPSSGRKDEDDGRQFFIEEPGRMTRLAARHPRLARMIALPDFLSPVNALPQCRTWFHAHVRQGVSGRRVLNLGSGVEKVYANPGLMGSDRRPGRAMLEVVSAYAAVFSDRPAVAYALRWLAAYLWLPVKLFDPWLSRKAKADTVVAACAILARKGIEE
jgi:uncharacterized protein YbaR (Trm112 family)